MSIVLARSETMVRCRYTILSSVTLSWIILRSSWRGFPGSVSQIFNGPDLGKVGADLGA